MGFFSTGIEHSRPTSDFNLAQAGMQFGNLGGTKNGTSSGLGLTKLVGTIGVTKKMSHIDNGPSPVRNYGETAILQILHILASFLECKTPIFFKLFPKRQFTVYNAEIFL